jgi:ribosomal protein L19
MPALPMENSHEFDSRARTRADRKAFYRQGDSDFGPGDTVLVNVKVVEGERTPHPGL